MHSKVVVIKVDPRAQITEIYDAINDATGMLGDLFDKCPDEGTVLLKPNYGAARKETDVNPVVTHALAKILVGPDVEIPDNDRHLIFYGNCTKEYTHKEHFINGCPPGRVSAGTGSLKRYLVRCESY